MDYWRERLWAIRALKAAEALLNPSLERGYGFEIKGPYTFDVAVGGPLRRLLLSY